MIVSTNFWIYAIISSIIFGFLVGGAQWIILRRYQFGFWRWILVTVISILIANTLLHFIDLPYGGFSWLVIHSIINGTFVGTAQFIILRKKFTNAGHWIPINILAVFFTALISLIVVSDMQGIFNILLNVFSGLIVGLSTGIVLIRLIILNGYSIE
jgi:hypothetical protein